MAPLHFLLLFVLGTLQPDRAVGQAINPCNLIPNPSFEQQNQNGGALSGFPDNVRSTFSAHDEVAGWSFSGDGNGITNGKPTYFATNAPSGLTNPNSNSALITTTNPYQYLGPGFPPLNNNSALNNGAISIITASNGSSPSGSGYTFDLISPTAPLMLTRGEYYASFQAYHVPAGIATRLGMCLSTATGGLRNFSNSPGTTMQSLGVLPNSSWTKVNGKITIPTPSSPALPDSPQPWYVTIGNFDLSTSSVGRARYHIDEVELYKIPTAGNSSSVSCSELVTLGEGCPVPGAKYAWSAPGMPLTVSYTSFQLDVRPKKTTTYTLTVSLPDGSTSTSTVTVTVSGACPKIIGPDVICPSFSNTYTADPSQTVVWTTSPTGYFTVQNWTGPTFTTSAASATPGQGYITATFINLPTQPTVTKLVTTLGTGSIDTDLDLNGAQKLCPGNTVRINVIGQNLFPPYYWTVTNYFNGNPKTPLSFTTQVPYVDAGVGLDEVDYTVTTIDCPTGQFLPEAPRTLIPWTNPDGSTYCDPYSPYRTAFNPTIGVADNYLEVRNTLTKSALPPNSKQVVKTTAPEEMEASLFDNHGNNVGSAKAFSGTLRIMTSNLPDGLYHVVMHNGGQVVKRSVLLQR
ncbi:hypothetical protein [Hymenobacter convexus]|uniref:hypothetical protein n=1 Tax=Hymenobacter sp. CA1UV-4 TaxID=3063782 RepID=UPI0027144523|nr:hypothetical protein [Hymenobacter sp. CA1UV-4]MDO7851363.1 hypothetical protein [Hymenobacter sp. CA1UV-4]